MTTQTVTELATFEPAASPPRAAPRKSYETPASVNVPLVAHGPAEPTTAPAEAVVLSKVRAAMVIAQVCGQLFFSSFCNGIIVVALPSMQATLGLAEGLLVWPSSSYFLTAGSCLLLAGSVADVVGNKRVNLVGSFFSAVFAMACGLARSGGEIIAFRALQGVTNAIITPSSISIISSNVEEGRPRNMGFAFMGFAQPLGFCFGLVLGGVFTDTVGWRPAFYLAAAASGTLFLLSIWALPQDSRSKTGPSIWKRLVHEIDCVGVVLASTGLASLSYVLASLSADINNIHKPYSIVLLAIAGCSIPTFVGWMHRQAITHRTALIPNSLWKSHVFTSCCVMVLLNNALTNCMELYSSLFCDLLFTVGLLILSDVFPRHMQALGGAVFNTCAQLGAAIGMSVTQVIASSVTRQSSYADKSSPDALMTGYRVAFWTMFGWMMAVCLVCVLGMRRVGVLGVKRD
ncbi:hypothetical protein CGMCC3_g2152 [Colletotrichum fructicola]|nr:uncharacterized protein CGMCC3_g2152 [Colletotrichum fructicola]KAE9581869.1 hypothetical protein CGMCC3_g2152 [Colletotrichum fructicola]